MACLSTQRQPPPCKNIRIDTQRSIEIQCYAGDCHLHCNFGDDTPTYNDDIHSIQPFMTVLAQTWLKLGTQSTSWASANRQISNCMPNLSTLNKINDSDNMTRLMGDSVPRLNSGTCSLCSWYSLSVTDLNQSAVGLKYAAITRLKILQIMIANRSIDPLHQNTHKLGLLTFQNCNKMQPHMRYSNHFV